MTAVTLSQLLAGSLASSFQRLSKTTVVSVRSFRAWHGNSGRIFCCHADDAGSRLHPSFHRSYTSFSAGVLNVQLAHGFSATRPKNRSYIPDHFLAGKVSACHSRISGSFGSSRLSSFFSSAAWKSCNEMVNVPSVKLNDGTEMPILGLGTYLAKENEGVDAVRHAIDVGYRHIDTAFFYQNEKEIGQVIKEKICEGVVKREDLYIVTKLWNVYHDPALVESACKKSLDNLGLDYIDLYLMHFPVGYKYVDDNNLLPKDEAGTLQLSDYDYLDTYKEMEKLVPKGWVKSIGISNFNSEQTDRILKNCTIKPVTNQVECHPGFNQKKLIEFSKQRDIVITAYSPLARPNPAEKKPAFLFDEKMIAIAEKYKKTPSQIALRYLVDIGAVPIPKSVNQKRIEENINIFDFKLTEDDIKVIDGFHTGERINPFNLVRAQKHKYFPFDLEY